MSGRALAAQQKRRVYYGWVIIFVTACLQYAGGTPTFPVLGLFLKPETAELGWSAASFAAPLTIGTLIGGFAGALTGPAMDRYGPRWIMTGAGVIVGTCFILMGFVHELWHHFVLGTIIRSVTAGAFFMVVGIVIPRWFVVYRGRAAAISGLGGSLGQFMNPIMVQAMIENFGWRAAWGSMGALVFLVAIPPVFFLLKNKPEDMGLLPDGLTEEELDRLKAEEASGGAKKGRRSAVNEAQFTGREALRTRAFYLMLLSQSAIALVISGLHFHWFSYMTSKDLSSSVAVASISISSLAMVPASLLGGFLAERYPLRLISMGCYLGFAISVGLLFFTSSPFMAYAYGIALGVSTGVMMTVGLVIWADYYGRKSIGTIRGMTSPIGQITNASGPLVASIAYDAAGNYVTILTVFLACSIMGSLLWLFATPPKKEADSLSPTVAPPSHAVPGKGP